MYFFLPFGFKGCELVKGNNEAGWGIETVSRKDRKVISVFCFWRGLEQPVSVITNRSGYILT